MVDSRDQLEGDHTPDRLVVMLRPKAKESLGHIRTELGGSDRTTAVNKALNVLAFLMKETDGTIRFMNTDGVEVVMPVNL